MGDYIDEVFGKTGLLSKVREGYAPREGQIKVARAAHEAIVNGANLLAEAGTGVGKTFAYGVPAVWWSAQENDQRSAIGQTRQKVLIVTANIALQEQITTKDLPFLQKVLPWKFSFALLKGMQNFLCLDRFDDSVVDRRTVRDSIERRQLDVVERWAKTTLRGDLSELPFEMVPRIKQLVVIGSEDCLGSKCPYAEDCFGRIARKQASDADIVVTNYHMFFLDLRIRAQSEGMAHIVPDYDVVIFDEAHKAPDIARDFFGFRITRGGVRAAARLLQAPATPKKKETNINPGLKTAIQDQADEFFRELTRHVREEKGGARFTEPNPVPSKDLRESLLLASTQYAEALNAGGWDTGRKRELERAVDKCRDLARSIKDAMEVSGASAGNVYMIEDDGGPFAKLTMKPLVVADALRSLVFESDRIRAVVMTSATLTADNRFDFIARELGCEDADDMVAESPFDWSSQCLLVNPTVTLKGKIIPVPSQSDFSEVVGEAMVELAEVSNGRMLGLFTSFRGMKIAQQRFKERGWADRLLVQGEQPRTQLVQRLKDEQGMVLLGVESLWAGIDVPGDALSLVAIDRLPFPNPEDPLLETYEELHRGKSFKEYSVPRAVIAFRQGFGRLIRTTTDFGAVVAFDRRLWEKGFGKSFLRSLPRGLRVSRDVRDVAKILGVPEAKVVGAR